MSDIPRAGTELLNLLISHANDWTTDTTGTHRNHRYILELPTGHQVQFAIGRGYDWDRTLFISKERPINPPPQFSLTQRQARRLHRAIRGPMKANDRAANKANQAALMAELTEATP